MSIYCAHSAKAFMLHKQARNFLNQQAEPFAESIMDEPSSLHKEAQKKALAKWNRKYCKPILRIKFENGQPKSVKSVRTPPSKLPIGAEFRQSVSKELGKLERRQRKIHHRQSHGSTRKIQLTPMSRLPSQDTTPALTSSVTLSGGSSDGDVKIKQEPMDTPLRAMKILVQRFKKVRPSIEI
ncbi:hypothetical protein BT63DRAFT_411372 [Microthyrium microscopicum]|uniref:Uncharacterized protein n=1 Tax=Microthyrium microscopicum TaxID=703497 RepID=A0A6A6UJW5_9PEZI|nr:hypothetical protein BT63DRAFT_411372 [Microthyrium microscopicum]